MSWALKRTTQCDKCPWRHDPDPRTIPNGYAAEGLLAKLDEAPQSSPDFRDAFGRVRGLQLGVPSGATGQRLFDVTPALACIVVRAHIAAKNAEIAALCELARGELNSP